MSVPAAIIQLIPEVRGCGFRAVRYGVGGVSPAGEDEITVHFRFYGVQPEDGVHDLMDDCPYAPANDGGGP